MYVTRCMMFKVNFFSIAIIAFAAHFSSGLYFHISETKRKCFVQDIPDDTTVMVHYRVEIQNEELNLFEPLPVNRGLGMQTDVRDPQDNLILSRIYTADGRISFTSHMPGEHTICLFTNTTAWFSGQQLRVHFEMTTGEHVINYAEVAQQEKLSEIQLRIRQLLNQVDQILKEQNYQRYREEMFRRTSESTYNRVFWWAITQIAVLIVLGFWQMRHLKRFFETKKLV